MPDLLLELFSEEIPARFQRRAADELRRKVTDALVANGLTYASAGAFVTPRRLALTVTGLPAASPDTSEERKGPRVGSPPQALEGFLRGAGLASIDEARIDTDPKKGEFYVAVINKRGAPAIDILSGLLPGIISGFDWTKSMRWANGSLQWVRPLRAVTATLGTENEEPGVIPFSVDGLAAGQTTYGHRFLAPDAIRVRRFDDYAEALERARVVLDLDRRKEIIRGEAEQLAFAQGLQLIADDALLEEVAGLVEWPNVMMGRFEESFLQLPEEVIIATIRANQKCFCLRDAEGRLANRFLLTANTIPADGGATVIAGNERVIRARLSDALFFYRTDLSIALEERLPKLADIVFHARLGNQQQRVDRLVALAGDIARQTGADVAMAERAALLAKTDLVTGMVGEFPELQGLMGRYYAEAQKESAAVADAIAMHYKPLGPSDAVPTNPVAVAVALADKLDMLTGFWSIGEKPTGSRDPYALRRAALGVIRIALENRIDHSLRDIVVRHFARAAVEADAGVIDDLLSFMDERLAVTLRDDGIGHDVVAAVLERGALRSGASVPDVVNRVRALAALLSAETGASLLAGYRRAANILAAEEKKDQQSYKGGIDDKRLVMAEEQALTRAVADSHARVVARIEANDFEGAIASLAGLREPVDAFFEAVLVNDADPAIRANRLNLLARLRDTMHLVADFSKIEG